MAEPKAKHNHEHQPQQKQMISTALPLLMDHVCECSGSLQKYMFWTIMYPGFDTDEYGKPLKNPDCKSSRYAYLYGIDKLCCELEDKVKKVLEEAEIVLPDPMQSIDAEVYELCWVIRWFVRRPTSPLYHLLLHPADWQTEVGSKEEIAEVTWEEFEKCSADKSKKKSKPKAKKKTELFGNDFMEAYLSRLKEDWSLTDAEIATFKEAIDFMLKKMRTCMDDLIRGCGVKPDWPQTLTQGFVDSHRAMGLNVSLSDVIADLLAMLFIAALYGTNDYRWEFGYLRTSMGQFLKTDGAANGFHETAEANRTLDTHPVLTRVTYDKDSDDELDYIICSEPLHFEDISEVRIGRAMRDAVVHDERVGNMAFIRLTDWRLDDSYMAKVSKMQAIIKRGKDGAWALHDWASSFGTLVISRSGERRVVGGENNPLTSLPLHNGDVICFGYRLENGRLRADALLPCYAFRRGINYRDMPDLRTRRHAV